MRLAEPEHVGMSCAANCASSLVRLWHIASLRCCEAIWSHLEWLLQTPEHDADHGKTNEPSDGSGSTLEVAHRRRKAADLGIAFQGHTLGIRCPRPIR
jgi:hypothetical protein